MAPASQNMRTIMHMHAHRHRICACVCACTMYRTANSRSLPGGHTRWYLTLSAQRAIANKPPRAAARVVDLHRAKPSPGTDPSEDVEHATHHSRGVKPPSDAHAS
eukprot:scaffold51455_cov70-Phaeocystis_antarctica.AAC.1